MYKHEIHALIVRTKRELWKMRKFHREEEVKHIQSRLDSLERLYSQARYARFVPPESQDGI